MGKFLNPVDKARKEARKKELKKNKKQRQQVRSAAIESRDPDQVIADLEKLDEIEYNVATNPSMSDSFFRDKRKRLKESWDKILAYYFKEEPERHAKLKKVESEYEAKHQRIAREFEGIKAAQELKIEDVFLPPDSNSAFDEIADDDPLVSDSIYVTPLTEGLKPPGCPPGLPPDFKLLVDNLKTSLVAKVSQNMQAIPLDLMNLRLPQISTTEPFRRGFQQPFRDRSKADMDFGRAGFKEQSANTLIKKTDDTTIATKTTVIESKPILFKPKATKFVPASVRSKLSQNR